MLHPIPWYQASGPYQVSGASTPVGLQSQFGDKALKIRVRCRFLSTAVLLLGGFEIQTEGRQQHAVPLPRSLGFDDIISVTTFM